IHVLHTDFTDSSTLTPQYNQHNEDVCAESMSNIAYELKSKSKEKFQKNVMLWDGISYQGLFPKKSPIFIDEWLELTRSVDDDRLEKATKELGDLQNVIFQDDQGIVLERQDERFFNLNKNLAIKAMKNKLYQIQYDEQQERLFQTRKQQTGSGNRNE
ncbi:unnamed protein product, partial [Rotaria sordida]